MASTHFSGPVAVGSGSVESITAAKTLTVKDDNGKTFILNADPGVGITLPAPSAGCTFKFITGATFATTDWVITATGAIMYGSIQEAGAQQTVSAATTINLELAAEAIGDYLEMVSDGTNWYVSGMFATALSVTPA